jgi:NAD(P)-dependent dehydrogenase (short-subunit alcohol dehydrogenase family)
MKTVLITGASRGIGKVTALRLARNGWHVHAGVRREEDGAALVSELGAGSAGRIEPLRLDVTSAEDVDALAGLLPERLDAVVNNAGIAVDGPVEALTSERLREQFEVNVVGPIAVTRAVLPQIRAAGGRIVFVGSVSGIVSSPWMGAYCGSKFALEALVDALRVELRPWKIPVSLVEPTNTSTDLWSNAEDVFDAGLAAMSDDERGLYDGHVSGMRRVLRLMNKTAVPAENVAASIEKALSSRSPRARYIVGAVGKLQAHSSRVSPAPVLDFVQAKATGVPRKA